MNHEKYYNTAQVARLLNRSEQTIRHWRKIGEGPQWVKDPRGRVHYEKSEVENWMRG